MNMKVTLNLIAGLLILTLSGCQSIENNNKSRRNASSRSIVAEVKHNNPIILEDGGTGFYKAVVLEDETLPGFTIYRPGDMNVFGGTQKLPIVLWSNGDCQNNLKEYSNFLNDIASYGYIVFASVSYSLLSQPMESGFRINKRATVQILDALDWAIAQNSRKYSKYYGKIDVTKVAVAGQSCGGLQVIEASIDTRVTTLMICNSGIMDSAMSGDNATLVLNRGILKKLHAPILYMAGYSSDITYTNEADEFRRIDNVPVVVMLNQDTENVETYLQPNGGSFAVAAITWLDWRLKGDSSMFDDMNCHCPYSLWQIETINFE
jgi:hypothetical protein